MEEENLEAVLDEIESLARKVGPLIAPKDKQGRPKHDPDREDARRRLNDIYHNSTWICARYEASKYLAYIPDIYALPRVMEDNRQLTLKVAHVFRVLFDNVKDEEKQSRLKKDFNTFYRLIPFEYLRKWVACEIMGYSKLRYIAMEHPIAAKVAGFTAAVGAVSGVVYGLVEYLAE